MVSSGNLRVLFMQLNGQFRITFEANAKLLLRQFKLGKQLTLKQENQYFDSTIGLSSLACKCMEGVNDLVLMIARDYFDLNKMADG